MPLHDLQIALTRLYTDGAFRTRFYANPDIVCGDIGASESDFAQLRALDRDQVERFARSLKEKRLGQVRNCLPAAARLLREQFGQRFYEYCDQYPSALDGPHEAMRFLSILRGVHCDDPAYLADVLVCEQLRIQVLHNDAQSPTSHREPVLPDLHHCPRLTSRACIGKFQFDMETLYPALSRGETIEAQPDPCSALIGKVHGTLRTRIKRINNVTALFLESCDGRNRLQTIVDEIAERLRLGIWDKDKLTIECRSFLGPMVRDHLIDLGPPGEECHAYSNL